MKRCGLSRASVWRFSAETPFLSLPLSPPPLLHRFAPRLAAAQRCRWKVAGPRAAFDGSLFTRGGLSCLIGTGATPAVLWRPLQMLGWLRWHKRAILELLLSLGRCSGWTGRIFCACVPCLFPVCLLSLNSPKLVTMYC